MESAQALDGDDATAGQQLNAALDDSVAGLACGADGRCRGRIPARIAVYSLDRMMVKRGPQLVQLIKG